MDRVIAKDSIHPVIFLGDLLHIVEVMMRVALKAEVGVKSVELLLGIKAKVFVADE